MAYIASYEISIRENLKFSHAILGKNVKILSSQILVNAHWQIKPTIS